MNDIDDVFVQVRDSLSGAHMDTPVTAILARSRSQRQRHRRRLAAVSAAGVAACGVLAFGLAGGLSSGANTPAAASGTIRTAAFTLARNANGTDTLTLNQGQLLNPSALQQALQQDNIPALVQSDVVCTSSPPPPADGVISPIQAKNQLVINPAAMPAGTELSFTYVTNDDELLASLIYDNSHTCKPAGSQN